jgi:hypothetical protein
LSLFLIFFSWLTVKVEYDPGFYGAAFRTKRRSATPEPHPTEWITISQTKLLSMTKSGSLASTRIASELFPAWAHHNVSDVLLTFAALVSLLVWSLAGMPNNDNKFFPVFFRNNKITKMKKNNFFFLLFFHLFVYILYL